MLLGYLTGHSSGRRISRAARSCILLLYTLNPITVNAASLSTSLNIAGIPANAQHAIQQVVDGEPDALGQHWQDRNGFAFQLLLDGFLYAYGFKCSQFLPVDKHELIIPNCDEQARNKDGDVECVRKGDYHTHVFIDKHVWQMRQALIDDTNETLIISLRTGGSALEERKNAIEDPDIREKYLNYMAGGIRLVEQNSCISPALKRFQENMVRFATQQPMLSKAVPLKSVSSIPATNSPPLPKGLPPLKIDYQHVDYVRFLNDALKDMNPGAGLPQHLSPLEFHLDPLKTEAGGVPSIVSVSKTQPNGYVFHVYILFSRGRPTDISVTPDGSRGSQPVTAELSVQFENGAYSRKSP